MSETPTSAQQRNPRDGEYTVEERRLLLSVAHLAIEAGARGERVMAPSTTPHLAEKRGVFTTLHLRGKLRGCIGFVSPMYPLVEAVAETARAAAFEDPRFAPVTTEARELEIEISVLSVPQPITPEEVVVGRHGLIASMGTRRGLLLPQVPIEWKWDREEFLSQTCVKAGLPPNSWQHGAVLEAFTAEVFGESDPELKREASQAEQRREA